MSVKSRLIKLEEKITPAESVWLRIIIRENDSDEVIDQLKAAAVEAWKHDNPGRETPVFDWVERELVSPKPLRCSLTPNINMCS